MKPQIFQIHVECIPRLKILDLPWMFAFPWFTPRFNIVIFLVIGYRQRGAIVTLSTYALSFETSRFCVAVIREKKISNLSLSRTKFTFVFK
jgi:hypothetical protein